MNDSAENVNKYIEFKVYSVNYNLTPLIGETAAITLSPVGRYKESYNITLMVDPELARATKVGEIVHVTEAGVLGRWEK